MTPVWRPRCRSLYPAWTCTALWGPVLSTAPLAGAAFNAHTHVRCPPACHAPILYLLVGGAPQSRPLSSRNSNSKQKKSPRCFLNTQLVVMASTASRLWPALFPPEELEGAAWPWLCTHSGTCHVYAPIICCFRGTCCCCCRAPVLPDSSAFSAGPLKSFLKMQYSKRTYEPCLVIFKFFNCSIAVDVRYYFYISSRCITQWLGICTPYEVITPISLVPIWHHT